MNAKRLKNKNPNINLCFLIFSSCLKCAVILLPLELLGERAFKDKMFTSLHVFLKQGTVIQNCQPSQGFVL